MLQDATSKSRKDVASFDKEKVLSFLLTKIKSIQQGREPSKSPLSDIRYTLFVI